MFSTDAMDRYITDAATAFIKEQKPLNDSITKIASDNGLNRDQISRVVEGANTEVYVQLMNQSSDKYVQFENADAGKIASAVHGVEKKAEIITVDYDAPPTPEAPEGSFLEKLAEEAVRVDQTTVHNQAIKLAGLDEQLTNSLGEVDVRFQQNSDVLYHLVKQAYLGGTSFGDIKTAVETVYDEPVVSITLKSCQEKLAAELDPKPLVMTVQSHGSVNSDNPIIKQAGIIVQDVQEFKTLREKRAEVLQGMQTCFEKFPETKHLLKTADEISSALKSVNFMKGLRAGSVVEAGAKAVKAATPEFSAGAAMAGAHKLGLTATEKGLTGAAPQVTGQAAAAATKPGMSKTKKIGLTLAAGGIGGMALEHHMGEYRKQQASMPMGGIAPQFAR